MTLDEIIEAVGIEPYHVEEAGIIYCADCRDILPKFIDKGNKSKWYDDSGRIENIIRPGQYGIKKIIPSKDQHPTEKPKQLPAFFINLHSQTNDIILDPFLGSGTTAVAAKELGRKFVGIEISEEYCAIAKERLRQGVLNYG